MKRFAVAFTALTVVLLSVPPARASSTYGPPYRFGYGDSLDGCSTGSYPLSECRSTYLVDASTGVMGLTAFVTSPAGGKGFGSANVYAHSFISLKHEVPVAVPAVRGVIYLDVARAQVTRECLLVCPPGIGVGNIDVFVDGDPEACGGNCAEAKPHTLVSLQGPATSIVDSRVAVPFELVNMFGGNIPAGPMIIDISLFTQVGSNFGTIRSEFEGTLVSVVVE